MAQVFHKENIDEFKSSSIYNCDLPSEKQPSSHLEVFREIPI